MPKNKDQPAYVVIINNNKWLSHYQANIDVKKVSEA